MKEEKREEDHKREGEVGECNMVWDSGTTGPFFISPASRLVDSVSAIMCLLELQWPGGSTHTRRGATLARACDGGVWALHLPRKFDPYSQERQRVLPTRKYHTSLAEGAWCVPRWDVQRNDGNRRR